MTLITVFEEDDRFDQDLEAAETLWRDAGRTLADLTKRAREEEEAAAAMKAAIAEYSRGYQTCVTERCRVVEARRKAIGANGGYAIDMAAAREEVASRLERLRQARPG